MAKMVATESAVQIFGGAGVKRDEVVEQAGQALRNILTILTEAGGSMTDLFGAPLNYNVPDVQNRNGLVASNGIAHDRIIEKLAPLLAEFGRKALPIANCQMPIGANDDSNDSGQ